MQFPITSKLPKVGTTIFTQMSQLAMQHQAVNLSQGFPDFDCDTKLVALVAQYMKEGMNQYAPMQGLLSLREQIAEKFSYLYETTYHPDSEITITAGGSEAIYNAITACVHSGDEVIIFEPAYDLYRPVVELNGGIVKAVALFAPDFSIDWKQVQSLISAKTRMIIINNPNNPSTTTWTDADMQALIRLTAETNIIILSDEVYEHLVFDERTFNSVCNYPELKERSFIVASFGKLLHTTGWKIGYCVAPDYLMAEFRKVHQFNVFSVHTPSQYAIAKYLKNKNVYLELAAFFQDKRDYFNQGMQASSFEMLPAQGTYFQLASFSKISQEDDVTFAQQLTIQQKVASIPMAAFYENFSHTGLVRFCFAKKKETLDRAIERLIKM